MTSSTIQLRSRDGGAFSAYVSKPASPNGAGLILLQEIFGINANIRATADAWAARGFLVIAPDLFWRQEPGVELDPGSEADRARAMQLMQGLDQAGAVADSLVSADWLRAQPGASGKVGAVGYCLGGKFAYLLAAEPGIGAAAAYYGVGIQGALDKAGKVQAPLLLHLAGEDHLCPPPAQAQIAAAFASRAGVSVVVHPGVGHAFARLGGESYIADTASRADAETQKLLDRALLELSPAEDVACASRILAQQGILDAFGHVSRRSDHAADRFFMARNRAPALVQPADVLELDLDGNAVQNPDAHLFLERFIHGEIYRARPDVMAIVHSHSPEVVPFTVVPDARIRPVCHMSGFLHSAAECPYDVADHAGPASDLLISSATLGRHFADHLGQASIALMRAHGYTVVGSSISEAVFRAIYTARNCEVELSARLLGTPAYLSDGEAMACERTISGQAGRAWGLWLHELRLADQRGG